MGFLGSILGTQSGNTGGAGLNYSAGSANIQNPVTTQQATGAYDQTQQGLAQQQAFLQALQAQGGVGNQSAVFQQQQGLANQLQDAANGVGPNPALNQLNQTTGQNVANQAALMASQRGASANPALLARQAAMQGAATQQQAAGQAATMNAQQQIAARQQLQAQQGAMAGLAGQQVGQQAGALAGYNQAAQGEQQNLLSGIGQQNNANVANQSSMNSSNAGVSQVAAQGQSKAGYGVLGALGQAAMPVPKAFGGEITMPKSGPQSIVGRHLYSPPPGTKMADGGPVLTPQMTPPPAQDSDSPSIDPKMIATLLAAKGGKIEKQPVMGEKLAKEGKVVPGKAKVKGNSYANDTVPALLSAGEVVIPRSVMQSSDPTGNAAKFVQAILAKQGLKKTK